MEAVSEESAGKRGAGQPGISKSYRVGNIGAGARVAMGEHITWVEGLSHYPGGDELTRQLSALMDQIAGDANLPEAERALAMAKTQAVADALPRAQKEPQRLQAALLDAQVFLQSRVSWAWEGLRSALTGETTKGIISGITEATVKGAIEALIGT